MIFFHYIFFLILLPLKFSVCLKIWFLDLYQVKVSCFGSYLMLYSNNKHYHTISANCCVRNPEMIFLKWWFVNYKIININQKKFLCVWRRPLDASKHTKTFSAKCFIIFFFKLMQHTCCIISWFFTQQFADIA